MNWIIFLELWEFGPRIYRMDGPDEDVVSVMKLSACPTHFCYWKIFEFHCLGRTYSFYDIFWMSRAICSPAFDFRSLGECNIRLKKWCG